MHVNIISHLQLNRRFMAVKIVSNRRYLVSGWRQSQNIIKNGFPIAKNLYFDIHINIVLHFQLNRRLMAVKMAGTAVIQFQDGGRVKTGSKMGSPLPKTYILIYISTQFHTKTLSAFRRLDQRSKPSIFDYRIANQFSKWR